MGSFNLLCAVCGRAFSSFPDFAPMPLFAAARPPEATRSTITTYFLFSELPGLGSVVMVPIIFLDPLETFAPSPLRPPFRPAYTLWYASACGESISLANFWSSFLSLEDHLFLIWSLALGRLFPAAASESVSWEG